MQLGLALAAALAVCGVTIVRGAIAHVDVMVGAGFLMPLSSAPIQLGTLGRMRSRGDWFISYVPSWLPANTSTSFQPDQGSSPIPIPTARVSLTAVSNQADAVSKGLFADAVVPSSPLCDGYLSSASQLLQPPRSEWTRGFNSSQGPFRVEPFDVPVLGDKGLGGSAFVLSVVSCSQYPVRVTGTVEIVWPSFTDPFHGLVSISGDVSPIQGQVNRSTGVVSMPVGPSLGTRVESLEDSVWTWVHSSPAHEHRPWLIIAFLVMHSLGLVFILLRTLLPGWEVRLEQTLQLGIVGFADWLDPDPATPTPVVEAPTARASAAARVHVAEAASAPAEPTAQRPAPTNADAQAGGQQEETQVDRTAPYMHTSPDEVNSMLALATRAVTGEILVILAGTTFVTSMAVSLAHHIELRETGAPSATFTAVEQCLRGLSRSLLMVVLGIVGGFWQSGWPNSGGVVAFLMACLVGGGATIAVMAELCPGSAEVVVAVPVQATDGSEWLSCDVLSIFDILLRVFAELAAYAAIVWRVADIATAVRAPWRRQLIMLVLLRRHWRLQKVQETVMATVFATVFGLLVAGTVLTWKETLVSTIYFTLLDSLVWAAAVLAAVPEPDQPGGLSGCLAALCERHCPGFCACYRRADGDYAITAQFGGMKQFLTASSMGPVGLLEAIRAARETHGVDSQEAHSEDTTDN